MKLWHNAWAPGDGDDPAVVLAFGGADYETVLALPARPWDPGERGDRVGRFAAYLCREVVRSCVDRGDPKKPTGEGWVRPNGTKDKKDRATKDRDTEGKNTKKAGAAAGPGQEP
jgi:hypothetical protein